ncbi:MAG TPA: thioredoxin domain-containing protein [Blastocatellia bacterium]|nr:thioredoxin domain-containing protein [Blastocatellia bacterium]
MNSIVSAKASARPSNRVLAAAVASAKQDDKKADTPKTDAKKPAAEADCGCEITQPPDVLAYVNGVKIATKEVDDQVKEQVDGLKQQVVEARKKELDLDINTMLLEDEAKKRGITEAKLIDMEVVSKVPRPSEAEAQAFYDKNKGQIDGAFDQVKEQVIGYLLTQRQQDQAAAFAESLRKASSVKVLVSDVIPPVTAADREKVLALVGGRKITSGDVENNLKAIVFDAQEKIYEVRKHELDLKINDILLTQEAAKLKVTSSALLQDEVVSKVKKVTEADARDFYDKNKAQIKEDFDQLKDKIIAYLQQQEDQTTEKAFADKLRKPAAIQVYLKGPEQPVYQISTEGRPWKGSATAPVTIVEFTDYQCPSCARTAPILQKLVSEYGDKVKLVVRDFPLQMHDNAFPAAEAAEAARAQGKYWEYTDILFNNQSALQPPKLKEYATQLGMDRAKFDAELDSRKYAETVQRDVSDGMRVGIDSTPTVFINGRKIQDKTYESLKAVIEEALKQSAKK